jgi:phosphatidylserine/phosphatidylglycerophosphate/cardiolipin synthase-like enzyme
MGERRHLDWSRNARDALWLAGNRKGGHQLGVGSDDRRPPRPPLLVPGVTCWRREPADRVAFLVDNSAYFAAIMAAMRKAERSIVIVGWAFDPRTRLRPAPEAEDNAPDEIGNLLIRLARENPELDVRILVWKSALPISASQDFFPHRAREWFKGTPIRFMLDSSIPFGACHHQKVVVIDDKVAFSGGGDISVDRWDTPQHLDEDPRRIMPGGDYHPPRHEVMVMMDGAAARMLGALARERWERATSRSAPPVLPTEGDPWPAWLTPDLHQIEVAVARTEPKWRGRPEVREIEALHLEAIRQARTSIYLENQYFTSPVIGEALAARLQQEDGPEVVVITTEHSPSYFDKLTMDKTRARLLARLRAADRYNRFRAYCPRTRDGTTIIVHSKVAIIDDRLLRIDSANLNNRSAGFDTECDIVFEARTPQQRAAITDLRARLIGHFLGLTVTQLEALAREGGLVGAMDLLQAASEGRLMPLTPPGLSPFFRFVAAYHLGDPMDASDSWRPWLRNARLRREMKQAGLHASLPGLAVDAEVDDQRQVI